VGACGNAYWRQDVNVKGFLYNFFMGTYPESFKPTDTPDRYTLRICATHKTWPDTVNNRAMKEAKKFGEANGYRDGKIVSCDSNRMLDNFDYTIDFVR
jgi:hypothetical protein